MTDEEFSGQIIRILESDSDDGQAAKSHLAAGRPIYYCDDGYPDQMILKWPDGRRELVGMDKAGKVFLIKALPPEPEALFPLNEN